MDEIAKFREECKARVDTNGENNLLIQATENFRDQTLEAKYSYNFNWLGRPIIQYPQDIVAMQEIIWEVKPDLIIETGIAHGGSLIFSASMMALLEACGEIEKGHVLGIDIDIREHNRKAIEAHPLKNRITMVEGSSIDSRIVEQVRRFASDYKKVLVCLDSNHTHDHVLGELRQYATLVSIGSYCVVFDTVVEDTSNELWSDRPWGKGDNPKTAVWEFLKENDSFTIDEDIQNKIMVTVAPEGYLKRVK